MSVEIESVEQITQEGLPEWWARVWAKIEVDENGCWLWQGYVDRDGYARVFTRETGVTLGHLVMYCARVGEISKGHKIDHLCHTQDAACPGGACRHRRCLNYNHFEPVTHRENVLRGRGLTAAQARQTDCVNGHPFTEENTYRWRGHRYCRTCRRDVQRNLKRSRRKTRVTA